MLLSTRLFAIPLLLLFGQLSAALANGHDRAPVFVLPETGLATIAPRHLEFLEGFDHTASLDQLRNAGWLPRLQADQSLVDGYWVRLRVKNSQPTSAIGIEHNYNTEKKIFAVHPDGTDAYDYWQQGVGSWMAEGRILGHYLVAMPPGETTTIYNFFRSKPFDRYMSKINGLDRMTIGPWKDIRNLQLMGIAANIAVIAIAMAFGLYYLFMFVVSRGNYFWLSASLFQIALLSCTTLAMGWVMKLPLRYVNSEFTLAMLSILFLFLVQFFRKSLRLSENFPLIDKIYKVGLAYYLGLILLNLYMASTWPSAPYLDLVTHPPDRAGPGLIKVPFIGTPFIGLLLAAAAMSMVQWRRGSIYAKYLAISFALPFLAVPISAAAYFIFDFSWIFWFVVSSAVSILVLAMFVTFGFAVAQQLNDMKALALAQQVRVTKAYQRFVPPQLLTSLGKESILEVQLGDQADVEMSILFSDIRSFTSISEKMTPAHNFGFVNAYLSRIGPIIRTYDGYIDKFMGDGVMALFQQAPSDAVAAAVAMQRELHRYNETAAAEGRHSFKVGMGINTGRMILGTLGEADRMEGSVISDAVNLASRLEGLTKYYGTGVLISQHTHQALESGRFNSRQIDLVRVKGKGQPVAIYEIIDADPDRAAEQKQATLSQFVDSIALYRNQEFTAALCGFKAICTVNPQDGPAGIYVERCRRLIADGWDAASWDGVETIETK
jgi:class 3 adenylate cyclase